MFSTKGSFCNIESIKSKTEMLDWRINERENTQNQCCRIFVVTSKKRYWYRYSKKAFNSPIRICRIHWKSLIVAVAVFDDSNPLLTEIFADSKSFQDLFKKSFCVSKKFDFLGVHNNENIRLNWLRWKLYICKFFLFFDNLEKMRNKCLRFIVHINVLLF